MISDDDPDKKRREEPVYTLRSATLLMLKGLFVVLDFIFRENLKNIEDYRSGNLFCIEKNE